MKAGVVRGMLRRSTNVPARAWALLVLAGLLFSVPSVGAAPTGSALHHPYVRSATGAVNSWLNYTTGDNSDITQVAVSPDGSYVAAASDDREVFVFSSASAGPLTPIGTLQLPANTNATSIALTDTAASTGTPLLFVSFAPTTTVAGPVKTAAEAWNVSTSGMFSGNPAWRDVPTPNSFFWVRQVVASDTGSVAAVLTTYAMSGLQGFDVNYFQTSGSILQWKYMKNSSNTVPVDLSIDSDGTRVVAAGMISDANPVLLSMAVNGYIGQYSPTTGAGAGRLTQGVISPDGTIMFAVTTSGVFPADPDSLTQNQTTIPNTIAPTCTQVSLSYNGKQVLCAGGTHVEYFNWSSNNWASATWKATFASSVGNGSMARYIPNYFGVSFLNNVDLFYLYPGMAQSSSAYYRAMTTIGTINDLALSYWRATVAIGSGHIASSGDEFTLATDGGVPTPAAPLVVVTPVTPSPGEGSAKLAVSWYEPNYPPLTSMVLSVSLTPGSSTTGSVPAPIALALGSTSYTIGGLSFSTNYTVTLTVAAYGGATSATSSPVARTTASAPAVQDPFVPLEVLAVVLLAGGLVVFYLFHRKGTAPKSERGPSAVAPAATYPSAPMPPPGGAGGP
ncbi:MAG: hypothetical protein KGJ23_01275 [Euryarchaeota archaeon]|nr:hypothetical protein [Euryarchaeota archaeon]MDE1835229.1 hypothetical protein [Euryarchaeota archaeon]MDE1881032.1 hypothetical protein [Euryarchaeota archaeon]MDE2043525.1 hypothetical protein [Thermoplasmata archaeon]